MSTCLSPMFESVGRLESEGILCDTMSSTILRQQRLVYVRPRELEAKSTARANHT